MIIAASQANFVIGDLVGNYKKISDSILTAISSKADLIVFSELALIGYPPEDLLHFSSLVERQNKYLEELKSYSEVIDIIVGGIEKNTDVPGKPYFNSAYFLSKGKIQTIRKTLLPTYDVFNEVRYFEPNSEPQCIISNGVKIALTICEDIWDDHEPRLYKTSPLDALCKQNPVVIFNISASPYEFQKIEVRKKILSDKCKKHKLQALYLNQTGCQTELLFDGNSMLSDVDGNMIHQFPSFEEDLFFFKFDSGNFKPIESHSFKTKEQDPLIELEKGLVIGIQDYFSKNGFKKAVLGSSGGIDSALVQALAAKALGEENVTALLMPSEFSSKSSVDDAVQLSQNLGTPYQIIPINEMYKSHLNTLENLYGETPFDITEENLQSRIRAVTLMAFSNKKGALLLNTSNKSELAVGYGTLYGDMCGALSVIGDLYKTQVYALSQYINLTKEIIPLNIIDKEPSAELRPDQKDSDSLPPYQILDSLLKSYIEDGLSTQKLLELGFDKAIIQKVLRLVQINEHKRYQAPPILKVSKKAFGKGRLIPLTTKYDW